MLIVVHATGEQAPCDPRILVSECDGDHICVTSLPHFQQPETSWVLLSTSSAQRGASAVDVRDAARSRNQRGGTIGERIADCHQGSNVSGNRRVELAADFGGRQGDAAPARGGRQTAKQGGMAVAVLAESPKRLHSAWVAFLGDEPWRSRCFLISASGCTRAPALGRRFRLFPSMLWVADGWSSRREVIRKLSENPGQSKGWRISRPLRSF